MVIGHHSLVAVAFAHSVFCYRSVQMQEVQPNAT